MTRLRTIPALFIALALPLAAAAQVRPADLSRGLLARFPFDGDAVDAVTRARAQAPGTRPFDGHDGRPRGALWFDGARGYVNAGESYQPQRFTVAAWIRPEAVDRVQVIASKIRNLPGTYQRNLELRLDVGGRLFLHVPSGNGWEGVQGQRPIAPGRWTHVAAVYDGARAQLYVDGVRDGTPLDGPYAQSRGPLFIGARPESGGRDARTPSGPTYFFVGAMEDVAIWDRPLADPEIAFLAGRAAPVEPPARPPPYAAAPAAGAELLGWYRLDGNAKDAAGQADATVVGKGARPAEDRLGDPQGALALGGREYVDLGARVEPEQVSLAAWVRPGRVDRDMVIFSKAASAGPRDRFLELRVEQGGQVSFALPGGDRVRPQAIRSSRSLAPGRWTFVAATFDGDRATLYLDGAPDAEDALQPFDGSRGFTFIGARPEANGRRARPFTGFEGRLDDVRIFRGALSAAEVAALARDRGPARPPPPGPGPGADRGPGSDDVNAFLVKVDRLVARYDAAVVRRSEDALARLEEQIAGELEQAERAARAERNGRIGGYVRRAAAELQSYRGRNDPMSLDRKRSALAGLSESLWNDLAQEVDDRSFGRDERGRRDDAWY